MKIMITGSRTITKYLDVSIVLDRFIDQIDELVSGHCSSGVDSLGESWAKAHDILLTTFPAQWDKYGPAAGMIRDSKMVEYCDKGIAIWDGTSKGTLDTINKLKAANKLLHLEVVTSSSGVKV